MNDRSARRPRWVALVHVAPAAGGDVPDGAPGAYVYAASAASHLEEFQRRVRASAAATGLEVLDFESPVTIPVGGGHLGADDDYIDRLAWTTGERGVKWGTFHAYTGLDEGARDAVRDSGLPPVNGGAG